METATFISVVNDYKIYEKCFLQNPYLKNNSSVSCVSIENAEKNEFISRAYNKFIESYDFTNDTWFVFCHNDWEVKEDITKKLLGLDKNKIYGPIGAVLYKLDDRRYVREFCGEIYDKKRDGANERLWRCKKNETGTKVDAFDCQCLIVHSSTIKNNNLKFDETLEFDLYVEDFCLNTRVNHEIESHILALNCCHWSQLESIEHRPSYERMIKYLNVKYADYKFSGTCSLIGNVRGLKCKTIGPTIVCTDRSEIYQSDVDLEEDNDPRSILSNHYVTDGAVVLDVGCACGDLGVALQRHRNATVVGMEYDKNRISIAQQTNAYEDVHQVDLNNFAADNFKQYYGKFDYIVFADVLEHINDPQKILDTFKVFLKGDGAFLVSLPNISHASIKMNLLVDDWTYTEVGILDKTHIRFFTHKSIAPFLAEIGLRIAETRYTVMKRQGFQPSRPWKKLPLGTQRFIYKNPHSFICQYVLKILVEEKTVLYGELCFKNEESLTINKRNMTKILKGHMSKRSPFGFIKKIFK